jgi:7,8-dihydro-6-hydroxymethylpterin dimethyltransferase
MSYLTTEEIDAFKPDLLPNRGVSPIERARRVIEQAGFWSANQQMGRRWPIGCVALEITQHCNLDCTLCYLSENSEAVKDLPLEEVFRRIELIRRYYGKNTDVQITGGDPTLRKRDELLAIVRVRVLGMRPTLMTNGIRATRALLEALAESGLEDVAYHVDTTQVRSGYSSEVELNALRQEYIDRVRGLPVSVMFNTTVHQGNFDEIRPRAIFQSEGGGREDSSFSATGGYRARRAEKTRHVYFAGNSLPADRAGRGHRDQLRGVACGPSRV